MSTVHWGRSASIIIVEENIIAPCNLYFKYFDKSTTIALIYKYADLYQESLTSR